jgi:uncharacterized protein YbbC (DUF1343 family)
MSIPTPGWATRARHLVAALGLAAALLPAAARAEELRPAALAGIADIVGREMAAGHLPGAVVLVGQGDRIVYRRAFGDRAVIPRRLPMRVTTIFDLASLTKVVATTTAIMQLVDAGRLDLDRPVADTWPDFAANGKEGITPRQLLTHSAGLPPDLDLDAKWSGTPAALARIAALGPVQPPGSGFLYSDVGFEALGELVRRLSGQRLDAYCRQRIFAPLGMKDTEFRPPSAKRRRIAPTDRLDGRMRWGSVQDPTAARMGGIAGHAGLFGTADDLARFAGMLLGGGARQGVRVLSAAAVAAMTSAQGPPGQPVLRGLGWDIRSSYSVPLTDGSYGHTGYTGTSLWIDPATRTYVIILTSRLHPDGHGTAKPLRADVTALVTAALAGPRVETGLDVLEAENFAPLAGLRVGLITNQSGIDRAGRAAAAVLAAAPGVHLAALFSPEHGLLGTSDGKVASGRDPATGLPVYSLYGEVKRPTESMLAGLDALVFDVQDVGARFYTYATTMAYAMEEAARRHIAFYVLDRPDPIDATVVQGPLLDDDLHSFAGYFRLPVRHGMTIGELATLFNAENHIGADLHVVRMQGYRRSDWYDDTGLPWVAPSPNLRTLAQVTLYPAVALVEGANVSVGRGTDHPFELVGAPWIDGGRLAAAVEARHLPGLRVEPAEFTPAADVFAGRACHGIRVVPTDRRQLDSPGLGLELIAALARLYPDRFRVDDTAGMVGSKPLVAALKAGDEPQDVAAGWQADTDAFIRLRARYLLY